MSYKVRPATSEDAPFLAHVMLLAARSHLVRGLWDVALEASEEDCLRYLTEIALTNVKSWAHYSRFIIAEVDGQAAAGLAGYDPKVAGVPLFMQAMDEVAHKLNFTPEYCQAIMERFAPIFTCVSDDAEGAWIIENVATLPNYRRLGLVDLLLREMLDKGRQQGFKVAQITILIGNTPAQKAYEKVGFKVDKEKRHPDFEAVLTEPGMCRMLMDMA